MTLRNDIGAAVIKENGRSVEGLYGPLSTNLKFNKGPIVHYYHNRFELIVLCGSWMHISLSGTRIRRYASHHEYWVISRVRAKGLICDCGGNCDNIWLK